MYCSFCGSNKHTIKNCPKTWNGQGNRNTMYCGYCGSRKHNINACPKTFDGSGIRTWTPHLVEDEFIKD